MSKCMTCKYALYDGMCLALGKFTMLDAPACGDYKPRVDVEVSQLKAENTKLRELLHDARSELKKAEDELGRDLMNSATVLLGIRMRELGIEVGK